MSTYSWSYRTASHRQPLAKRVETDQEDPDKSSICQIESDKMKSGINNTSSSQDNGTVSTGTTKRLNWKAKIYVGNLNKKTNEASLAYYFSVFGDIEDIKLIRDHDTRESRGFAFITFEKIESAEKAKKWCSFNYPTLDDNSITVASAERKTHKIKPKNEPSAKRHPSQTLFWEFKWRNSNDVQVYGPYETSLMQAWKNQGYFDGGCWVRQVLHRQVCRSEEVKVNSSVLQNDKNESCEPSPCKKPKLMIDYSDSEDETEGTAGVCGDEILRNDEGDKRGYSGNTAMVEDTDGCENTRRIEGKAGDTENSTGVERCGVDLDDGEKSENEERVRMDEPGNKVVVGDTEECEGSQRIEKVGESLVEGHGEGLVVEIKHDERLISGTLLQGESEQLRPLENDKVSNFDEVHCEDTGLSNDTELRELKETNLQPIKKDLGELTKKDKHTMGNDILRQSEPQVGMQEENKEENVGRPSDGDHEHSSSEKTNLEENYEILQMYEKGSTVLPENNEQGEQKINDDGLRPSDYSSSEEEDIDDSTDDIPTEFVAISEIDFNLYP